MNTDTFLASYIETALWSSTDEKGMPLDSSDYADIELSKSCRAQFELDCTEFIKQTDDLITPSVQVAHDFWLTRNHHGAGFWDGDYSKVLGQKLTDISHGFGECNLYIGDDNLVYCTS